MEVQIDCGRHPGIDRLTLVARNKNPMQFSRLRKSMVEITDDTRHAASSMVKAQFERRRREGESVLRSKVDMRRMTSVLHILRQ